jgi:hypothetical protein
LVPCSVAYILTRLPLFKFPNPSRSWIGPVGLWFSHDWIDATLVSSKAAKRDDASIGMDMWNKHLLLLYSSCNIKHLTVLLTWLLCRVRRLILQGLCGYLHRSYGPGWAVLLVKNRCLRALEEMFRVQGDKRTPSSCLQGG